MFRDRSDAAAKLVALLEDHAIAPEVVAAIPRGGVPIGRVVADAFGVPLVVVVVKKIGAPGNPELGLGAVTDTGLTYVNDTLLAALDLDPQHIQPVRKRSYDAARETAARYGLDPESTAAALADKRVVIVDDGLATGATVRACCKQVDAFGAASHVVAVPVASPESVVEMQDEGCEVLAVETPPHFGAVGQFYESFDQVDDSEVLAVLDETPGARRGPAPA